MSANNPEYDFKWCPGCGDFGVRRALESAIQQRHAATGIAIENNVVVAVSGVQGTWFIFLKEISHLAFMEFTVEHCQ
ncbi:MAG: hypothetical protein CM1200mP8_1940 [Chloroflexota bacterium]|nr:MAG: hypothetical protein CM1200mP8_1940 [Chloroflexota bacterium]